MPGIMLQYLRIRDETTRANWEIQLPTIIYYLRQQKVDAYERGGIPSDRIVGIKSIIIIPAAYLLLHGVPEKPAPFEPSAYRPGT